MAAANPGEDMRKGNPCLYSYGGDTDYLKIRIESSSKYKKKKEKKSTFACDPAIPGMFQNISERFLISMPEGYVGICICSSTIHHSQVIEPARVSGNR